MTAGCVLGHQGCRSCASVDAAIANRKRPASSPVPMTPGPSVGVGVGHFRRADTGGHPSRRSAPRRPATRPAAHDLAGLGHPSSRDVGPPAGSPDAPIGSTPSRSVPPAGAG